MNDNGGPAFPVESHDEIYSGMTLRDYFAAKASERDVLTVLRSLTSKPYLREDRAKARYIWADALLAARSQSVEAGNE